jgi:hypothetical protein
MLIWYSEYLYKIYKLSQTLERLTSMSMCGGGGGWLVIAYTSFLKDTNKGLHTYELFMKDFTICLYFFLVEHASVIYMLVDLLRPFTIRDL